MERREILGSVVQSDLTANISNSASSFQLTNGSTFPTGDSGRPFVVVINRNFSTEEKVLISSRSGNIFTVAQRGYDGTTAVAHTAGEFVDHVLDATAVQDMNDTTYDNQINIWMGI